MDIGTFSSVFLSVFTAELGDKTQLATLLFASDREVSKLTVFLASSLALVVGTGLAVAAGKVVFGFVSAKVLRRLAGFGFIAIGIHTLLRI